MLQRRSQFVNQSLIRSVRDRAKRRCEYCHMPESAYPSSAHADHIVVARQNLSSCIFGSSPGKACLTLS